MSNETNRGAYWYGKTSWVTTEEGTRGTRNLKDTWIGIPFPPLVDEKSWEPVRARKFKRVSHSKAQIQDLLPPPAHGQVC